MSMDEQEEALVVRALADADQELNKIASKLKGYLQFKCMSLQAESELDFRFRHVDEPRIKPSSSVIRSLNEQNRRAADVWTVDDVVGARVVVVTTSDAAILVEALSNDDQHSLLNLSASPIEDESGYKALHVKGVHASSLGEVGCEIQIRTMLQDAWAIVSRQDLYKRGDLPEILRKTAQIQAIHLTATDEALELIRQEARRVSAPPVSIEVREEGIATDQIEVIREEPSGSIGDAQTLPTPPPPTAEQLRDEEFIITSRVSDDRKASFLSGFLEDRAKAATTERLFRSVEAFQQVEERNDSVASGFLVLMRKGPFVEGSSWLPYHTWDFALAAERHVLNRLGQLLHESTELRFLTPVRENWDELLAGIGTLWEDLKRRQFDASLIAISGRLETDLLLESHVHLVPHWELPEQFRTPWILGALGGVPVLHLRDMTRPGLFVIDLRRFGRLTRFSPTVEFSVEEFSEARARELLAKNPDLIRVPEGRQDSLEEKVRELQLHVGLRLYESLAIQLEDPAAVAKAKIRLSD